MLPHVHMHVHVPVSHEYVSVGGLDAKPLGLLLENPRVELWNGTADWVLLLQALECTVQLLKAVELLNLHMLAYHLLELLGNSPPALEMHAILPGHFGDVKAWVHLGMEAKGCPAHPSSLK